MEWIRFNGPGVGERVRVVQWRFAFKIPRCVVGSRFYGRLAERPKRVFVDDSHFVEQVVVFLCEEFQS